MSLDLTETVASGRNKKMQMHNDFLCAYTCLSVFLCHAHTAGKHTDEEEEEVEVWEVEMDDGIQTV